MANDEGTGWTCPKCGPLKSYPLSGKGEKMHCPNIDCDEEVDYVCHFSKSRGKPGPKKALVPEPVADFDGIEQARKAREALAAGRASAAEGRAIMNVVNARERAIRTGKPFKGAVTLPKKEPPVVEPVATTPEPVEEPSTEMHPWNDYVAEKTTKWANEEATNEMSAYTERTGICGVCGEKKWLLQKEPKPPRCRSCFLKENGTGTRGNGTERAAKPAKATPEPVEATIEPAEEPRRPSRRAPRPALEPVRPTTSGDDPIGREARAIEVCARVLEGLDNSALRRVLGYVTFREAEARGVPQGALLMLPGPGAKKDGR